MEFDFRDFFIVKDQFWSSEDLLAIKERRFIGIEYGIHTVHSLLSKKMNQELKTQKYKEKEVVRNRTREIVRSIAKSCTEQLKPVAVFLGYPCYENRVDSVILPNSRRANEKMAQVSYYVQCALSEYTDKPERWANHFLKTEEMRLSETDVVGFLRETLFPMGDDPVYYVPNMDRIAKLAKAGGVHDTDLVQNYLELARIAENIRRILKDYKS